MKERASATRKIAKKVISSSTILSFALLAATAAGQAPAPPDDATAPLRRFPISLLVRRADDTTQKVSLLRLDSIRPKDDIELRVDPDLAQQWTFVAATLGSGQRIDVKVWNLWEKKYKNKPVEIGKVPSGDVVPLYFLVLNKGHEGRVLPAVRQALEVASQQIISQTATFDTKYQEQNRFLNFMSAYAALGPVQTCDPTLLKYRVAEIDADLGMVYDPDAPQTQPGTLQHGLDAGVGLLNVFRQSPDDPGMAAAIAQQQLPPVVGDWVGLVGDLMHIFIKPPRAVKLTFIPASATECDPSFAQNEPDAPDWMQLMTQRVLDSSTDSLPALVFRPQYIQSGAAKPMKFGFSQTQALAGPNQIAVQLAPTCNDLFVHPYAWDWEYSDDGKTFTPITGAHLVPGQGLVFPITDSWWNGQTQKHIFIRTRVGFDTEPPMEIQVAKATSQQWSLPADAPVDFSAGDGADTIQLDRKGPEQPFYRFAAVSLTDSAGKIWSGEGTTYNGRLITHFNLSGAAPGNATVKVLQEGLATPDSPVTVFVASRRPAVAIYYGKGDNVLRVSGPDAGWVKSIVAGPLFVKETDDSQPGNRKMTLSGPLPPTVHDVQVTYHDPQRGLEWTHSEPIAVGLPRPKVEAVIVGAVPTTIEVGAGTDPTWAEATMPAGWFSTKIPVRVQLEAVAPFAWSHDVSVDLGFGSSGDVQQIMAVPEGPLFAFDEATPDAYVTLNLDTNLPPASKRNSGLLWFQLARGDLSSSWVLVQQRQGKDLIPIRAVKLPTVQSIDTTPTGVRITLANADEVLGVKFAGQTNVVSPQLGQAAPNTPLLATVDGPAGATEFDLQMRDGGDAVVHVKIVHPPK